MNEDVLVFYEEPTARLTATFHALMVELKLESHGQNAGAIRLLLSAGDMHRLVEEWQRRYAADVPDDIAP